VLKPKALDHVGILVTDMDRSLAFYCDVLGLKLLRRRERGGGVQSAVLAVGGQELNIFSDATLAFADGPTRLDHLCLEIDAPSIDGVVAALGDAVKSGPTKRSEGMSLFVHDPDGCRVELIVKQAK
jgi:catechol 2,3-dioxygenase-like lactoylglutathione lyase family enzyme